ncbi:MULTISPECIES: helix-turn-helix domain-containing protein [Streptomyces]|uniref:XRE family transcriptional regulator n=1 Tax=Streptomyces dengpaensis TaxID=2049881 RepID=A0ABN5IBJ5_9ACTN|nr:MULTISPECIES: helix-turn-helix transcriptional regulator [Streptomyces]AVH60513.1 XRE family transcriptional regulator [Streptomyces dengpaensis]PIB07563.1 transcriptional regulator [Streptomyces sp. HG99]
MSNQAPHNPGPDAARVIPLRPAATPEPATAPAPAPQGPRQVLAPRPTPPAPLRRVKEPLWRDLVGDVLRRERLAQERTLKDVADAARISMPYLSELERGRKEASSEVLAAAARALGLGLTDLLSLAQDELTRLAQAGPAHSRSASASRYDGMCLAA